MYCDVCGDDLTHKTEDGTDYSCIGITISLEEYEREKAIAIFGKSQFYICYCCWLKSLGVKPKE